MRLPSRPVSLAIAALITGASGLFLVAQTDPLAAACNRSHALLLCRMEHPYVQVGVTLLVVCLVLGAVALSLARKPRGEPGEDAGAGR